MTMMRVMLQEMTTLDVDEVIQRMSPDDLRFVHRLIATCQSGTGFMNDLGGFCISPQKGALLEIR